MSTLTYTGRPDAELVAMCLTGDAEAWETLLRRYRRFIYSIPVKFGLQPDDAADIFQTVCVKWIEHLHELRDERKLKPWLFTTTTRPLWEAVSFGLDIDNVFIRVPDGAVRLSNGVWLPANGFPTSHNLRLVDCELILFGVK